MTVTRRTFLTLAGLGALGVTTPACRPLLGQFPGPSPSSAQPSPYRLPWTVVPDRYEIRIEPDLRTFTFTGEETIHVTVREPLSEIVLNAAELQIPEATIRDARGETLAGVVTLDGAAERARLRFPQTLRPGPWRLGLRFAGILNDRLQGFYRARGATGDGNRETVLAVTQFESADARRAFPCWDEPAFKAVFQVALVIDETLTAISNAATLSEPPIPGTGKKVVSFAPTIKMSTYLVAFVVGELEATDVVVVDGTPLRIWCLRGKRRLAGVAMEMAAFALHFSREYYGLPYPGDKLDLIAIPDFDAGAMENLGAIMFRESLLLVEEKTATRAELERVADQVAHEIAHMWFGDLVTMAWWNGLWLNEAFATFMQMLTVDALRPDWQRWTSFGVSRDAALLTDGLSSSRPIEFEVVAPRDAEAMFDVITYEKGAAVLRMLEQYLGPAVFRQGIHKYLATHQFGNAETADLWRALGEVSNQRIATIMNGWIVRPGYPIVTVRAERGGSVLSFSQRRFTYLTEAARNGGRWGIPIHVRVRVNGQTQSMRLLLSSAEERVELPGALDWVVVNEGGHGFYRTQYAADLLEKLAATPSEILTAIERFNLVNDAWAAALAGLSSVREYLDLTERFRDETDRNVWTALIDSFAYLGRVISPRDRPALTRLVRDRLGPAVGRLGWSPLPGESELTRQLRGDLLRAVGTLGNDSTVQAEARDLYAGYRADRSAADPNVVLALLAILAWSGGAADYQDFLEHIRTAQTPQEERRYLYFLAGFRDPELIRQTLRRTINGEIRTQDAPVLVRSLLMSVDGRELAWGFVKENARTLERQYPQNGFIRMWEGITALATPELEADVRRFFASSGITLGGKTLEQYLEQLRVAVAFGEREAATLAAYLSRFTSPR